MHRLPPTEFTLPVMTDVFTALSLANKIAQVDPVYVPMLNPMLVVDSGSSCVSVAWTGPVALVKNVWVTAPFLLRVPVNVSVIDGTVGAVGSCVGVESPH